MHKKILSFSAVLAALTILLCSCADNKNPLPAIFTNSASLNFKGVEQTKMVATSKKDNSNKYIQTGTSGTSGTLFNITFSNKPTKDTTVNLSESGLKVTLTVFEGTTVWNASSGIINTTVKEGVTTSTFNSIDFANLGGEHAQGTGSVSTKD
ncbi:hypothetical protein [Sporocytophaga myxococcoides]|uniref:hypothetical protein n=1 Tax=Sporocytophaga myxococcoides TaxID=153721 RepID=UPI0004143313|nr:hypothetical protein [Sporocytophaga myxococcoides]